MTDTTAVSLPPSTSVLGRAGRRFGYHFTGLFLAVPAFSLGIAGFAAGVGSFVVWVGIPILAATLVVSRWFADLERRSTELALGRPLPPHHYKEPAGGVFRRMVGRLGDAQSWRDLLHAIVGFPGADRDVRTGRGLGDRWSRWAARVHLAVVAALTTAKAVVCTGC